LAERSLELFFFELQLLLEEHESRVVRLVKSWRPVLTKELDDLERTGRISSLTALPALAVSIARLQPWVKSGKDGQTVSPGLTKTSFLLQPPPLVGETPHPDVLRRMREVHRWVLVGIPFTQIAPRVNETEDTARRDERAWQRIYGPTPKDLAAQLDELKARGSVVTETPVRIVYRISDVGQSLPDPELAKEEVNE